MYHDIIRAGDNASGSGLTVKGAEAYKLSLDEFEKQLEIAARLRNQAGIQVALTFDDGGSCSLETTAPAIEKYGFTGKFFIPTAYVNTPGFVIESDIRELSQRGHIIGSHSHTHPYRMNRMKIDDILREWEQSTGILSEITGQDIFTASVPGGWYSEKVALAAQAAGITELFTSKPDVRPLIFDACRITGRFAILKNTTEDYFEDLLTGKETLRNRLKLIYNLKSAVKLLMR